MRDSCYCLTSESAVTNSSTCTALIQMFNVVFIVRGFATWLLLSLGKCSVMERLGAFQIQPGSFSLRAFTAPHLEQFEIALCQSLQCLSAKGNVKDGLMYTGINFHSVP